MMGLWCSSQRVVRGAQGSISAVAKPVLGQDGKRTAGGRRGERKGPAGESLTNRRGGARRSRSCRVGFSLPVRSNLRGRLKPTLRTGRVRGAAERVLTLGRRGNGMALTLAERSRLIAPSATLAMAAEAKKLKAEGIDVLDFALGEPDFHTPANIQEAAIRAMQRGQDALHAAGGDPRAAPGGRGALHQAARAADQGRRRWSSPTGPSTRSTTPLMAVCGPGDEVIIPAPYWVSYSDLVKLTGATPIVLQTTEARASSSRPSSSWRPSRRGPSC